MNEERARRKLSGILSADAVGYSRLMQEDEASTIRRLEDSKELMANLIQQYRGRVVDAPGDNLLAEFGSVVDATECAVKIQRELKIKNAELPDNRKMEFRIGLNLGDVVEEAERIYGDGVNIAARIEGLAEPGGICISRTAYDHVKNKLEVGYEYLGEHSVKNIAEPVRVYRVLMDSDAAGKIIGEKRYLGRISRRMAMSAIIGLIFVAGGLIGWNLYLQQSKKIEPASMDKMAYPLPDKPSIAVLPFDNMSGDPNQDNLADGVTESIIAGLALVPEMLVISRYSMFTYKGKPVKVQQVSEELGVRYVLEGSIQRSGDLVRITAQLIDALSGHHVWANHYDRDVKDLFNLLDEITKKITVELQVQLTHGDLARLWHKTDNFEAWGLVVRAWSLLENFSRENLKIAEELSNRAVQLDPKYGFAWSLLAYTHFHKAIRGWSNSPAESFKKAISLNHKALELDNTLWCATAMLGSIKLGQGKFEEAIALGRKSIALGPNIALMYPIYARTLFYAGRFEEAIAISKKGIRLQPYYPVWYLSYLGLSYRITEHYDEALKIFTTQLKRAKQGEYSILDSHLSLADVYSELGEYKKARVHVDGALKLDPNCSLKTVQRLHSQFKDPVHLDRIINSLRKAGLPEHS
jgi:adenylate cyclase